MQIACVVCLEKSCLEEPVQIRWHYRRPRPSEGTHGLAVPHRWSANEHTHAQGITFWMSYNFRTRNACVSITDGNPLKISQQRNRWVYYMDAFPMRKHKGVSFVSHSERCFFTDDGQLTHRFDLDKCIIWSQI